MANIEGHSKETGIAYDSLKLSSRILARPQQIPRVPYVQCPEGCRPCSIAKVESILSMLQRVTTSEEDALGTVHPVEIARVGLSASVDLTQDIVGNLTCVSEDELLDALRVDHESKDVGV